MLRQDYDVVIIGGGIAGSALATVMARSGKAVLVLEHSTKYTDRVRGEFFQPWGVAEAQRLQILDALTDAGGAFHTRYIPYDETMEPAEAEAAAIALDRIIPGVPGTLGISHPLACEALASAAAAAGAGVQRGVEAIDTDLGEQPVVRYRLNGLDEAAGCRLVVGAEGRESGVRRQAGIALQATEPRLLGAGLLVDDLWEWRANQISIGTQNDLVFFVLPQGSGRARIYLMFPPTQRQRFSGPAAAQSFLKSFPLSCIPGSDCIARATPAGPCATFPMNDTWTDSPVSDGVALIGDAAGYSDPHLGQGLSVALRDVRLLSDLLLASDDWSPAALRRYAEERAERMRRLRFCNRVATTLRGEFGPEARQRRRLARQRMQAEPDLAQWRLAAWAGPESAPPAAFDEHVCERLFASG